MRRDRLLLEDMIEACEAIQRGISGVSLEQFKADEDAQDKVLWRFTKLGEATSRVSEEVRARHPDVEWQKATAFRNKVVHGYFDIDEVVVYMTATDDVPRLLEAVHAVVAAEFPEVGGQA